MQIELNAFYSRLGSIVLILLSIVTLPLMITLLFSH